MLYGVVQIRRMLGLLEHDQEIVGELPSQLSLTTYGDVAGSEGLTPSIPSGGLLEDPSCVSDPL